ncbi:MAG: hypothetical protein LBC88_08855 [Spirochaetaceae bacterium]|jgi:hypothetical protein|nr:hypothetical protein [Spirochaetaceae bacterium]
MVRKIPYVKREQTAVDEIPGFMGGPPVPVRNTPVSARENTAALYHEGQPYWLPLPSDASFFVPPLYNNNLGRGGPGGITDAFGIAWEWIDAAGGSIVRPGEPLMASANEWKEKVKFPDLDAWDWEGEAQRQKIDTRFSGMISLINGFWFERLVSFMDFSEAAIALIDPDQQDAIKELFEASTGFACRLVDKLCAYWPALDGIQVHDDWGAQKDPFFSNEVAYEFFVPYMKVLTDHIHAKGRYTSLHSCGHVEHRVRCFIDGGFDQWDPQTMNDTHRLYDEFGDKIIISVIPDFFDAAATPEEDQRQAARNHVDRFCQPGKPSMLGFYAMPVMTPAFISEIYEYSRRHYFNQ